MIKPVAFAAAIVAATIAPVAAVVRYDLSAIDVIKIVEMNGFTNYFLDPVTRPCWTDPLAWEADLASRGYTFEHLVHVGEGTNIATGEEATVYIFVEEPHGGEGWAVVDGEQRICLHVPTYSTEPNI